MKVPREIAPAYTFHTVNGIAREMHCSPWSVYQSIRRGELKATRINSRGDYRIRSDWYSAFIEARSITCTSAYAAGPGAKA